MTDLTTLLKDADPVRDDEGLSSAEAQAIRRAVLSAVPQPMALLPAWQRPLTLAAAAALVLGVSGVVGHRAGSTVIEPGELRSPTTMGADPSLDNERRQLQFATPGGTRIIWVFDQNLRLQESMP